VTSIFILEENIDYATRLLRAGVSTALHAHLSATAWNHCGLR
jgi:hypothetical protein